MWPGASIRIRPCAYRSLYRPLKFPNRRRMPCQAQTLQKSPRAIDPDGNCDRDERLREFSASKFAGQAASRSDQSAPRLVSLRWPASSVHYLRVVQRPGMSAECTRHQRTLEVGCFGSHRTIRFLASRPQLPSIVAGVVLNWLAMSDRICAEIATLPSFHLPRDRRTSRRLSGPGNDHADESIVSSASTSSAISVIGLFNDRVQYLYLALLT